MVFIEKNCKPTQNEANRLLHWLVLNRTLKNNIFQKASIPTTSFQILPSFHEGLLVYFGHIYRFSWSDLHWITNFKHVLGNERC